MKASYRISEQDYVNAMKLYAKLTPRVALAYFLVAITFVVLAILGPPAVRASAVGGLIGGVIVIVFGRFLISPMLARKHYRNYKAMHEEFAVELLPEGVRFSSPTAEGTVTWNQIHKWRQNEEFVLIYPMPRIFHIVPKSAATQGFDLQGLTDRLLQHVGKPA